MAVHSGDASGAKHHRCDVLSLDRQPDTDGQPPRCGLVVRRQQDGRSIGLVAAQSRVRHTQTPGQLACHCREHLGRRHRACDQCRDPSQRGMLVSEYTVLVTTRLGLVTALVGLSGPHSCLAGYHIRQYRDGREDQDRDPALDFGREETPFSHEMDVTIREGAGQRRHRRQPKSPTSRDHKDSEQIDNPEGVSRGDPHQQSHQDRFHHDEDRRDNCTEPQWRGRRLYQQRRQPSTRRSHTGFGIRPRTHGCHI